MCLVDCIVKAAIPLISTGPISTSPPRKELHNDVAQCQSVLVCSCSAALDEICCIRHTVFSAALDLLLGILQQPTRQPDGKSQAYALERGVSQDEHSAALKLLEVTVPPRSCLLHAAAELTQNLMLRCMDSDEM